MTRIRWRRPAVVVAWLATALISFVALVGPEENGWEFIPDTGILDAPWRIAVTAAVLMLGSAVLAYSRRWSLPALAAFLTGGVAATAATWFLARSDLSCCPYMTTTMRGYPYPYRAHHDADDLVSSETIWTMALVDVLAYAFLFLLVATVIRACSYARSRAGAPPCGLLSTSGDDPSRR
ncbi:hypothetical protein [Nocardia asteroides]|uniref:hypothetical protein n=1 Tax=Nocardia asteroides TaxID=1824 RepID=UPI003664BECA